ncbi:hypothetical protein GXY_15917 [Novacetimonas hansenii ATCC 23769]|uniref:Uncharacterized protein n=1 Tax=Novacetimonas hansenii ATCC 23769 TaxID=714995 RepID=D5QJ50_NOVHA|nr:hypothetical protein GXY_15917 [Novacetimonas hansenii ATCC 23769]
MDMENRCFIPVRACAGRGTLHDVPAFAHRPFDIGGACAWRMYRMGDFKKNADNGA